jgi:hypothetical protein
MPPETIADPLAPAVDLEGLGRLFRALENAESRILELEQTAEAEARRVAAWLDRETAPDRELATRLRALIADFARQQAQRQQAIGGHKRVSCPFGECEVRAQQPEYERDAEILSAWAEANGYTRTPPPPAPMTDWERIRKAGTPRGDRLVLPDGEVVPGVVVRERPDSVIIRTSRKETP